MKLPGAAAIHLWCVANTSLQQADLAILDAEELLRYRRIAAPELKQQFWQTRLAIRHVLSLYAPQVPASQWRFARNAHGKPELEAPLFPCPLRFNITHTPGIIVIAVCTGGELGVDVEHGARSSRRLAVAERYFSAPEVSALRLLDDAQQRERFTALWTLKEAYSKACGVGLANVLGGVSFHLQAQAIDVRFSPQRDELAAPWRFWQLRMAGAYRVALALRRDTHPTAYTLEAMELRDWREVLPMQVAITACTRAS